ncbi:hypothetical protein F5Y06DRAFT_298305 [Hypoxylon sp. FL0890]|nr:hypothetical protein F5Y06DRAFT_298305 [Hypoxylon sp. FL0890]
MSYNVVVMGLTLRDLTISTTTIPQTNYDLQSTTLTPSSSYFRIDKMRFTVSSVATVLLAALQVASTTPLQTDQSLSADTSCGQSCTQASDCTGICSYCSMPAEDRWQCRDFDTMKIDAIDNPYWKRD